MDGRDIPRREACLLVLQEEQLPARGRGDHGSTRCHASALREEAPPSNCCAAEQADHRRRPSCIAFRGCEQPLEVVAGSAPIECWQRNTDLAYLEWTTLGMACPRTQMGHLRPPRSMLLGPSRDQGLFLSRVACGREHSKGNRPSAPPPRPSQRSGRQPNSKTSDWSEQAMTGPGLLHCCR